jgi:sugar/nucleoside kinase (ribokinase family)
MKTSDISIAGEINLDLIMYGLPEVMTMERELLGTDFQLTLGSSSAILAHNIAVLGLRIGFICLVGRDALGKVALERLGASGVDLTRVRVSEDSTATGVTLILPHRRDRHILTYPGTMANLRLRDLDIDYLKSAKHFHLSSLFLQHSLERRSFLGNDSCPLAYAEQARASLLRGEGKERRCRIRMRTAWSLSMHISTYSGMR